MYRPMYFLDVILLTITGNNPEGNAADGAVLPSETNTILSLWYQSGFWGGLLGALVLGLLALILWKAISRHWEKKIRKTSLQERLLLLDSKARLNQLKPHFIFNALVPIQNHILAGKDDKALDYLNDFSKLMRNMLEISNKDMVLVAEEISFLNKYLKVLQMQHSYSFTYNIIDHTDKAPYISLPAMMIQPLVENAMIYGMSGIRHGGYIEVSIKEEGSYIVIEVRNNFNVSNAPKQPVLKGGHALQIIQERIQLMNQESDAIPGLSFQRTADVFVARIVLRIHMEEHILN